MNIFFLRGLVREKEHWSTITEEIKDFFPNANIYFLEIPGVGEHYQQTSPDNFDDMIEFMRSSYIDQFDGQKNLLISISLGGMIARNWAYKYPDDFSHIVLMNSSFKGITPLFKRLKPSAVAKFIQLFCTKDIQKRELGILELVANDKDKRKNYLDKWIHIQANRPVSRKSFVNQIKSALTCKTITSKPENTKLLILAGKEDRLCNYESSLMLHKAWGGELKIHPTAGHDLPIDASTWVLTQIKEWLENESV
ncbi:MAG: alpha/beta hydrolase [Bacteriovoracaceae bacterium]|jgi:pimeloyl-ACP methyl ester carboxylesterase|nr:alpha/beta hydrolase [Bacteriovoracaceae bacterium]